MRKRAVVPGTLFSRNSPRVPERATGLDPSTVMDASGIGSPLLASTIVPPIVCVWVRAGAAHVAVVRRRRPIAREPGDERICDIRPPSAEDPDGLPRDVPKQVSPIAIREMRNSVYSLVYRLFYARCLAPQGGLTHDARRTTYGLDGIASLQAIYN